MTSPSWTALLLLIAAGCAQAPHEPEEEQAVRHSVSDQAQAPAPENAASAWLADVRAAHGVADGARERAEKAAALATLRTAIAQPIPLAVAQDDATRVRRDLYTHAAQLALDLELAADADALIRDGLALPGSDPFRAQLLLLAVEVRRAQHDTDGEAKALQAARTELGLK